MNKRIQLRRVYRRVRDQGIANRLNTVEGREELAKSMVEPMREMIEFYAVIPVIYDMTIEMYCQSENIEHYRE